MKKLLKKVNFWPIILAAIAVVLCVLNYTPGTWLSGWDTLHPEFNFTLYFKRIFFGVWQEHQGLGALATQAHASEIPRMLILYPLSFILPQNLLRYSYFFLTLIGGCLGMFYFLQSTFFKNSKENIRNLTSFSGGLFYLLNLATLQQYYLPLEMFATHFAFLPWLLLFANKILLEGGRKNYLGFVLLTFFNAPLAHTPTLFYAYLLGLLVFDFGYFITLFQKRELFKKSLIILLLTLVVNSFWLLPHLYFVFISGDLVQNSKISSMFSQTAILTGQKFGGLKNTLFLKNYLFAWGKYDLGKGQFVKLFLEWNPHLNSLVVIAIQYILVGMVLTGLFWTLKERKHYGLSVLSVFLVSFLLIANDAPIIRGIYSLLQNNIPLFKEALRFSFTKFSILLAFSEAVFFGVFWEKTAQKLVIHLNKLKDKDICRSLGVIVLGILVYFMLPSFKGNLFHKDMRVVFPKEYFLAMDYLNSQENQRIALMPMPQIWGWSYHDWNYEGAGFEWFGLQAPLLDREFDRWNSYNEQFYWEASYALYSKNRQLFENVLEKYQVGWLLVDESVINPSSPKASFFEELEKILNDEQRTMNYGNGKFELVQTFGKIKIYKVNLETPVKDFVYLANDLPVVNGYEWGNRDQGYIEIGNYISLNNLKGKRQKAKLQLKSQKDQKRDSDMTINDFDIYYPFRSLFTGRKIDELNVEIEDLGDRFVFRKKLPKGIEKYKLMIPNYDKNELMEVDKNDLAKIKYFIPTANIIDNTIEVIIPKVNGLFSAEIDPTKMPELLEAKNCNQFDGGKTQNARRKTQDGEVLLLEAEDTNNCSANFYLPNLSHRYSYLISAESKNISGRPLLFWVENLTNRKADMELYLKPKGSSFFKLADQNHFIQPPMAKDGLGYMLHFDNISIGRQKTVNELGKISVHPIPYEFLLGLKMVPESKCLNVSNPKSLMTSNLQVEHPNPVMYEIKISGENSPKTTLILSQAYHGGWKSYVMPNRQKCLPFLCGKEIKNHVKVNNWANGWQLPMNSNQGPVTIYIFFWPQLLEYLGFVLLIITPIIIWRVGERSEKELQGGKLGSVDFF